MEHEYFKGKKNTEEIVKEKAWYLASLIVMGSMKIFEIINKEIGKNQVFFGVEFLNKKKISKSSAEFQIVLANSGNYAARKLLTNNLEKIFTDELIKKLAEFAGNMKEEYDLTSDEYMKLASERFAWYQEMNVGKEFKYELRPGIDIYKIISEELFGVFNEPLLSLFEKTEGNVWLNMNMEGLLEER